jgi:hypothetical protein
MYVRVYYVCVYVCMYVCMYFIYLFITACPITLVILHAIDIQIYINVVHNTSKFYKIYAIGDGLQYWEKCD